MAGKYDQFPAQPSGAGSLMVGAMFPLCNSQKSFYCLSDGVHTAITMLVITPMNISFTACRAIIPGHSDTTCVHDYEPDAPI